MSKRLASACTVFVVSAGALVFACGGGDDGGGGGGGGSNSADAGVATDAKVFMDAPGSGSGATGLGQPCTPPAQGSGQGDCPAGYTCLALEGASGPWCSKTCVMGSGDTCAAGYTGPGVAGCINQVSFNGSAAQSFCGVTCAGDGVNGCTTATCNGTCPGQMTCNGQLLNGSGSAVGSACQ